MIEILAQIEGGKRKPFTAGIVLWDDAVVEAAPIVRYMKRWRRSRVREYCMTAGWRITVVHQIERPEAKP
jgi:hypothetical protein